MKTKPTSVRLDNELLKELEQRCKKVGCSRNDFIKNSIELAITNQTNFDFGDDEEIEEKQVMEQESPSSVTGIRIEEKETGRVWIQDENGKSHEIKKDIPKATITWN